MSKPKPPAKPECYKNALAAFAGFAAKEPQGLVAGSLPFALLSLPIVSFGPSWLSLVYYMGNRRDGIKTSWKKALGVGFCAKAWAMGVSDFLSLVLAAGSLYAVLGMGLPMPARYFYGFVMSLDLTYYLSGIYRYPALALSPNAKLRHILLRGVLMAIGNPIWTLLFACANLLLLLVCGATGVGLLLLYPAGAALLSYCAYNEMVKQYLP